MKPAPPVTRKRAMERCYSWFNERSRRSDDAATPSFRNSIIVALSTGSQTIGAWSVQRRTILSAHAGGIRRVPPLTPRSGRSDSPRTRGSTSIWQPAAVKRLSCRDDESSLPVVAKTQANRRIRRGLRMSPGARAAVPARNEFTAGLLGLVTGRIGPFRKETDPKQRRFCQEPCNSASAAIASSVDAEVRAPRT